MDSKFYKEIGDAVKYAEKNGGDLTTKNLKYVVSVAKEFSETFNYDDLDALIAEGVIAMRKAEMKYDPSKNDNFTKYCAQAIRGYMNNLITRNKEQVHVPVNHMAGFKAGMKTSEEVSSIKYKHIDALDYDILGTNDSEAFEIDEYAILLKGIDTLDINGQIAVKMKLKIGEFSDIKKNSIQAIASKLDVTIPKANKIYKDAIEKLSNYCQKAAQA